MRYDNVLYGFWVKYLNKSLFPIGPDDYGLNTICITVLHVVSKIFSLLFNLLKTVYTRDVTLFLYTFWF